MKHCIACGKLLPEASLFELTSAPASAQDIPDAASVQQDKGVTLQLRQCSGCGLVQFDCDPVPYYRDVIRAGGGSSTMRELRTTQYRHLIETYHLEGKTFFEAGCGRGEFLKFLQEFPVEIYGMEHRADLVETAQKEGLHVWREFPEREDQHFGHSPEASMLPESGWSVPEKPFDVFLSFNFLEHQPRPDIMLKAIWNNLAEDGMGLVTVPSLEYILEKGSYYELIRDHIAYYTFDTLTPLLERNGFVVEECEIINRDTLSVVVKKRPQMETGNLLECYVNLRKEMDTYLKYLKAWNKKVAIWGASHQGFTLAATTKLGKKAEYIIDSAPFKQGKFAPASHLPIVGPEHFEEHPVDAIVITAPGYTDEIAASIRERFGKDVEVRAMRFNHLETL